MSDYKIAVIGLGYVGLPLAVALSKNFEVLGYDLNTDRISELENGLDKTLEISTEDLKKSSLKYSSNIDDAKNYDIFIVTVPTPVDEDNHPDLHCLESASKTLGKIIGKNSIVVYESTVYPSVTEDFCMPILEQESGLKGGIDFFVGYSPERINPGDRQHTVDKITKIVSGQTTEVAQILAKIYGSINNDNIFIAKNIKTAEAAKVIENAQRDINIAFINEVTTIFNKMGISIYDVLDAASTKWNFLRFTAGLVGGHCIGVDPYYLAKIASDIGHNPDVILSGRRTNEAMSTTLAQIVDEILNKNDIGLDSKILILGITFKENVPDLRNTKVTDFVNFMHTLGYNRIEIHDPMVDFSQLNGLIGGVQFHTNFDKLKDFDAVIGLVPHNQYLDFSQDFLKELINPKGLLIDLKGIWRNKEFKDTNYFCI
jgi:UDP-N-acetyl-D-galactosamine dehydrogenase